MNICINKERCNAVCNDFLALNKNDALPLSVKLHTLLCKDCRKSIRLYRQAENLCAYPLSGTLSFDDPRVTAVMKRITDTYSGANEDDIQLISLKRWIIAGCILVGTILLFGLFGTSDVRPHMQILLYLCFAGFISGYCAFFVGGNLQFFIKKYRSCV